MEIITAPAMQDHSGDNPADVCGMFTLGPARGAGGISVCFSPSSSSSSVSRKVGSLVGKKTPL